MANNAFELLAAKRPRLVAGNNATYGPGTIRLPEDAIIDIKNRSFSIIAEVENPDGNAEGMIVTHGGETGGYALLVQNGKPVFHLQLARHGALHDRLSRSAAQRQEHDQLDFAYDGGGPGKGGMATLSVNGRKVAEGRIENTVPIHFSIDDTFDVGEDWGTPVSPTYKLPFKFTGNIKR